MTRDDIDRMAKKAGFYVNYHGDWFANEGNECLERFAALVAAAEREKVAHWMMERGYATGHGDTIEDLLKQMEWQVAEREREAILKLTDSLGWIDSDAIRARGDSPDGTP